MTKKSKREISAQLKFYGSGDKFDYEAQRIVNDLVEAINEVPTEWVSSTTLKERREFVSVFIKSFESKLKKMIF